MGVGSALGEGGGCERITGAAEYAAWFFSEVDDWTDMDEVARWADIQRQPLRITRGRLGNIKWSGDVVNASGIVAAGLGEQERKMRHNGW